MPPPSSPSADDPAPGRESPPRPPPREFIADTLGKRLSQARLEKGLTIDEAAHETKVRPDKILALESDDYGRFGNNAYAKGFLVIYGRFLGVDVADQARALDTSPDIRIAEYEYLSNAPAPEAERSVHAQRPRKPSLLPLAIFAFCLVGGAFCFYLYVTFKRLGSLEPSGRSPTSESIELPPKLGTATPPPTLASATAEPFATVPAPERLEAGPIPGLPRESLPATPEVRRAEAVAAVPAPAPAPVPSPQAPALPTINEIVIEPLKKTWVKISRDDPKAPPIFMDYLYPNAGPLKLRGTRFFIDARDPTAIQIRKNGTPIAYEPGAVIQ